MGPSTDVLGRRSRLLTQHFFNRRDVAAHKGKKPHPVYPTPDRFEAAVRSHLDGSDPGPVEARSRGKGTSWLTRGPLRLGSYCPAPDGTTVFACVDVDGDNHARPAADPLGLALAVVAVLKRNGIACHLERSKSGKGWHVWVFFAAPVRAALARRVLLSLLPEGEPFELFPKRDDCATAAGLGSAVFLPWWHGAGPGCNEFYRVEGGAVHAYEPGSFCPALVETFEAIAGRLPPPAGRVHRPGEVDPPPARARTPPAAAAASGSSARLDPDRECEPIHSIQQKALGLLAATGRRHDTVVWLACQLRDNRHGREDAVGAVRHLALSFPHKEGDDYTEADALADLDSVWGTTPRAPSGRRKKEAPGKLAARTPGPPPGPPPPPITRGPAAGRPAFEAGIVGADERDAFDCPDSITRVLRWPGGPLFAASKACRRNVCGPCRLASGLAHVLFAEERIALDLTDGRSLFVFDGTASRTTMGGCLERLGARPRYLWHRLGDRWLLVGSMGAGARPRLPRRLGLACADLAAAVLRRMLERAGEDPAPYLRPGEHYHAFRLSPAWQSEEYRRWRGAKAAAKNVGHSPLEEEENTIHRQSPTFSRRPLVVATLTARSHHAIAEDLRRRVFGQPHPPDERDPHDGTAHVRAERTFFDPLLKRPPKPGGRTSQWNLYLNPIRELTEGEERATVSGLEALSREPGGPS